MEILVERCMMWGCSALKRKFRLICLLALLFAGSVPIPSLNAQSNKQKAHEKILSGATITASNIQTAIVDHLASEPDFAPKKQQPEEKPHILPPMLFYKDNSFKFDWTIGQHARYLMEALRQGIHALQSATELRFPDMIALPDAKETWPKLRDIVCEEYPGVRYFDLDGFEKYCPEQVVPTKTTK